MFGTIDCFLPCSGFEAVENTLRQLRGSRMIRHINLLVTQEFAMDNAVPDDCSFIVVDRLSSSSAMKSIAESVMADYAMMFLKDVSVSLGQYSIQRMARVAAETDAAMVYSDRLASGGGKVEPRPVIDYIGGRYDG